MEFKTYLGLIGCMHRQPSVDVYTGTSTQYLSLQTPTRYSLSYEIQITAHLGNEYVIYIVIRMNLNYPIVETVANQDWSNSVNIITNGIGQTHSDNNVKMKLFKRRLKTKDHSTTASVKFLTQQTYETMVR